MNNRPNESETSEKQFRKEQRIEGETLIERAIQFAQAIERVTSRSDLALGFELPVNH